MKTAHRCCRTIFDGVTFGGRQCSKMAKFERNGKWYCGNHDPVAIELKAAANLQKFSAKLESKKKTQKEIERKTAMYDELLEALINLRKCISETRGKDATEALIAVDSVIAKAEGEM